MYTRRTIVRLGGWLFKRRTSLPVPLAVLLLVVPSHPFTAIPTLAGLVLIAAGESLRLWAVRHIGAISRTRSDRLGPVIASGPFAYVRNPLYLGNIALWVGFTLAAGLAWLAPLVAALLGFEYHAIVRWEETMLDARHGDEYRAYRARVSRWIPDLSASSASSAVGFSWPETLFSERGTLIAIAVGLALLWIKARF